jgi:hypothetical protein
LIGLSKDKYSKEYFKHRNHLIPLRWLAPEILTEDDYTIKSDIFAFAVLVWELFTSAKQLPFEELSNEVFFGQSSAGTLEWKVADETPKELKEILVSTLLLFIVHFSSQNTGNWETWNVREVGSKVVHFTSVGIAPNQVKLLPCQPRNCCGNISTTNIGCGLGGSLVGIV